MSEQLKTKPETGKPITGFKTAKGSVYTYDDEGKTTRFKTVTGEQLERQDITVFSELNPDFERQFMDAIHTESPDSSRAYVLERQPDDTGVIIRNRNQITDPDQLFLGIVKNGEIIGTSQATLEPKIGSNVFDYRHFTDESGIERGERHLGNKVVEILYD